jgi:hypothetical protein
MNIKIKDIASAIFIRKSPDYSGLCRFRASALLTCHPQIVSAFIWQFTPPSRLLIENN